MMSRLEMYRQTRAQWLKILGTQPADRGRVMSCLNTAQKELVDLIREAEYKLGRSYRHLPRAGIYQGQQRNG